MQTKTTYLLTLVPGVGCYYTDQYGVPWSTCARAGEGSIKCDDCKQEFQRGYMRGGYDSSGVWHAGWYNCGCRVKVVGNDN